MVLPLPSSTLFPYTTLFRSHLLHQMIGAGGVGVHAGAAADRVQAGEDFDVGSVVAAVHARSEEHTSELQSRGHLVCRLLLEKKNTESDTQPLQSSAIETHRG